MATKQASPGRGPIEDALIKIQDGVASGFVQGQYWDFDKPGQHCLFGWAGFVTGDVRASWRGAPGESRPSDGNSVASFLNRFFKDYMPDVPAVDDDYYEHWNLRRPETLPISAEDFSDRAPHKNHVIWFLDEAISAAHDLGV